MKVVSGKLNYLALIGVIVGLNTLSDAAPSNVSINVNQDAVAFAFQLIREGHLISDRKGAWREHKPSSDAENEFIRGHGIAEYAKWHLGMDERYGVNAKRRYKFPYGDFTNVHRCGLLAVKARARQHRYDEIENAATELERQLESKPGTSHSAADPEWKNSKQHRTAATVLRELAPQ
jgi:hypothetical protein